MDVVENFFQFISWVALGIWLTSDKGKVFEIMLESTDHGRASQCHSVYGRFVAIENPCSTLPLSTTMCYITTF